VKKLSFPTDRGRSRYVGTVSKEMFFRGHNKSPLRSDTMGYYYFLDLISRFASTSKRGSRMMLHRNCHRRTSGGSLRSKPGGYTNTTADIPRRVPLISRCRYVKGLAKERGHERTWMEMFEVGPDFGVAAAVEIALCEVEIRCKSRRNPDATNVSWRLCGFSESS
jgi:hypothetical protein